MERFFRDIPTDKVEETDQIAFLGSISGYVGCNWTELLKSDRILIISEAGSGKTFECQSRQQLMWHAGEAAFFLELGQLANTNVRDMLSPEEEWRFDEWLKAQADTATFFLDSYDELKLTLGSFEQALKRLAKAIQGQLGRSRIVITSRPIPIDQHLFRQFLPIPEAVEDQATGDAFADLVLDGRKQEAERKDGPQPWRNVALIPFLGEQIREMAQKQGITDPEALLADIRKRNAEEFARRPQDLIELCADWRNHRRIRTHLEQIRSNIEVKLEAQSGRPERAQLSLKKAMDGASRLALAALLTRKLTLRHSAAADRVESEHAPLDPASILFDWSAAELATLLERPLFGFASYGRVRFHHRSVIEYLAAERIMELIRCGMPVTAAKRLLFAITAQGVYVVKPSMQSVAAWLAISNESIYEEIRNREPSVLLNFGDPESLRPSQRVELLREFVSRYGLGGWRGLKVPQVQIHRFASAELAKDIQELWARGIHNPEVREVVLNLIEVGRITACADIVYRVGATQDDSYERIPALRALAALNDGRLDAIMEAMALGRDCFPNRVASWAAVSLFPSHFGIERLGQLLARIVESDRSVGTVSWQLPKVIEGTALNDELLDKLRSTLTELSHEGASLINDWSHIAIERQFLVPALSVACLCLLRRNIVSLGVIESSVLALRLSREEHGSDESSKGLRRAIAGLHSTKRRLAFEADDALMQQLRPELNPQNRLIRTAYYGPLTLSDDMDAGWIRAALSDKGNDPDIRAVMLEAAIRFSGGARDPYSHLAELRRLVSDLPQLVDSLDARAEPPKPSPELQSLEAEHQRHQKKAARKKRDAHASWVKFWREVASHPEFVFADDRASNTAWNLWRAMERSGSDSRASGWNRRFIESNFGKDTADRLRAALMATWRKDHPTLRSERKENEKNTHLVRWQLGLAGIAAEAEDSAWAMKLNEGEARLAVRYVPLDLNGFPSWLEGLAIHHPSTVECVLGGELSIELEGPLVAGWHSMMLQNIGSASPIVASILMPRIERWLVANVDNVGLQEQSLAASRVSQAVCALLAHGSEQSRTRLYALSRGQLADGVRGPGGYVWLPVLFRFDPSAGVAVLEKTLAGIPVETNGDAVALFGSLFGDRYGDVQFSLSDPGFTPQLLLQLLRLSYQYVRPSDDVEHNGVYSPNARDHAERGRNAILTALLDTRGLEGWSVKLEMIEDPLFAHFKDRIAALARERSAEDADSVALGEKDVLDLYSNGELPPATCNDMFALLLDRLEELDDLLLHDDSPRAAWALIVEETHMRQQIARELRHASRSSYTVDQEAATAENKETDIRLRSARHGQEAIIELKIGEKRRSAADLKLALKEQLVKKYMAPRNARSGCLLITAATQRRWRHPDTCAQIDLSGLIAVLNVEAKRLEQEFGGEIRIIAKGLDLTRRLPREQSGSR